VYELKNHMETVAQHALQDYLAHYSLPCACERCQADILALALNKLPARYSVSLRGQILTSLESQGSPDQAKIMAEIVRASKKVANSPSHTPER